MKLEYFLYNAFLIEDEETRIAIDPGLNLWLFELRSLIPKKEWKTITHVLVTHGDPDHFVYAVAIAKKAGATVVCREALMEDFLSDSIEDVHKIDVGAKVRLENISVGGLNAKHGPLPVKLLAGLIDMKNEIAQGAHAGKKVFLGPVKIVESVKDIQVYSRGTIELFYGLIKLQKENVDFARGSIGFKIAIGDKSVVNLGDTVFQEEWEGISLEK